MKKKPPKTPSCARSCSPAALALLLLISPACGDGDAAPDAAPDRPAWSRELPPAGDAFGVRRGWTPARGIIHLHSPYSHDACDGNPRDNLGAVDEECLADLKAGLCATRMDYAALTDHDDSMADEDFETLFVTRGQDELIEVDGAPVAARIHCDNGHIVLLTVGGENDLMPIMLDRHPELTVAQRHDYYNANTGEASDAFRTHGGLTWIAHSEQHDLDEIRTQRLDGMEIYNLHANIDPGIRRDWLGLDSAGAIEAVLEFADQEPTGPEPDLALLSFLHPNEPALEKWQTLLGEGVRIAGTAGTDAHQNALPIVLRDGERGDSYRRMIRWFANVALVEDRTDPAQIEAAITAGRFFVAFEVFGTPQGFDAVAGDVEMGGEITSLPATLTVTVPTVLDLDPRLPEPAIRARVLRIAADGTATEIAGGAGPTVEATLADDGGVAYRVEVLITPHHLGPYLGTLGTDYAEREQVWIYSNPFYVASAAR